MPSPPTLFFDIGGVLLTNGWDTPARKRAAEEFGLDYPEFQARHEMLKTSFETGKRSLKSYVQRAVFHRSRTFSPDDFIAFMYAQSQPIGDALEWSRALSRTRKCRMFTLNNESRELHEYRTRTFGLGEIFQGLLASCYLGMAKPDEGIYTNALGIANCSGGEAIFIDDRPLNVEAASALGLHAVLFTGLEPLREYLRERGIQE